MPGPDKNEQIEEISPWQTFLGDAQRMVAIVIMLLATLALIVALTSTGYSLAHGAWQFSSLSKLTDGELDRMNAVDSLFWAPGLYAICWLSFLDKSAWRSNVAIVGVLTALLAFDAVDDVKSSTAIAASSYALLLAYIAINISLLAATWIFVRRWPFRLTLSLADAARPWFFRIPGIKRYFIWMFDSWAVPATLSLLCLLPSVYQATRGSAMPGGDIISFTGMFIVVVHLLAVSNVAWVVGTKTLRRKIYWSALAFLLFGAYSLSTAMIDVFKDFAGGGETLNIAYFFDEWVFYLLILICLFIGTIFSELLSATPFIKSSLFLTGFAGFMSLLVFFSGEYWVDTFRELLKFNAALDLVAGAFFSELLRRLYLLVERVILDPLLPDT